MVFFVSVILYLGIFFLLRYFYNKKIKNSTYNMGQYLDKNEKAVIYAWYPILSIYLMSSFILIGLFFLIFDFKFESVMFNIGVYWLLYYVINDKWSIMLTATDKSIICIGENNNSNEKIYYSHIKAVMCSKKFSEIIIYSRSGEEKHFKNLANSKKFCKYVNENFLNSI